MTKHTNDLASNSFMTPVFMVDELVPLLTGEELKLLLYAMRKILSREDPSKPEVYISQSAFRATLLSKSAIQKGLDALRQFRILLAVGSPTSEGQQWELGLNDRTIDWDGLRERQAERQRIQHRRTQAARQSKRSDRPVGQDSSALSDRTVASCRTGQLTALSDRTVDRPVGQDSEGGSALSDRNKQQQSVVVVDSDSLPQSQSQQQATPPRAPTPEEADQFAEMHIPERLWQLWMRHDAEHVLACALHAQAEADNPPGLLRRMLEDGAGAPKRRYIDQARALLEGTFEEPDESNGWDPRGAPSEPPPGETSPEDELRQLVQEATEIAEAREASGLETCLGSLTVGDIWRSVRSGLQLQLNADTWDTYVRDARAVRYADGVLTVQPQHPYGAEYLQVHLQHVIDQVISRAAGQAVHVEFVAGDVPAKV